MATVSIMDPVTRIEGHMKVELSIDTVNGEQQVVDAKCTGTLFRGFEKLLTGRNPQDATVITPRICGVCPVSHGDASVKALEDAAGVTIPANARLLRNLILGANFVQSHILHFYLLSALDYVKGPAAQPWQGAWEVDFRPGLDGIAQNIVKAVEARRRAHEMGAIFAGRMPSATSYVPGGLTVGPNSTRVSNFRAHLDWLRGFINNVYLPDARALAETYGDYRQVGAGSRNLMAYGVFETTNDGRQHLLGRGIALAGGQSQPLNLAGIRESVRHSWYGDASSGLHPSAGAETPVYPKTGAYSWLKAPRLDGRPIETGALARMWVNGDYRAGISVMDRHLARADETRKIAEAMVGWLGELQSGSAYDVFTCPTDGAGVGLTEAPRGALGHWMQVSGSKLSRYQIITPTCWNASPRDDQGVPGPLEQALIGTPVQDAVRPVEALRVIHSFDPCLSCAVHVMQPGRKPVILRAGAA